MIPKLSELQTHLVENLVGQITQRNQMEAHWFTETNVPWVSTIEPLLSAIRQPVWLPQLQAATRILIHGDYDVDGITSTRMVYDCLHYLNPTQNLEVLLPKREDGYGFTAASVLKIEAFAPDFLLIFDCGSNDLPLYQYAEKHPQIPIVVFDHHVKQDKYPAPPNLTIINSHQFGLKLCAAGLAFSLVYSLTGEIALRSNAFGMAALGTVADAVPLNCPENLILVQQGLEFLNQKKPVWATKISGRTFFDATTMGFYLGPRINAISRVGDDPRVAFQALGGDEAAMVLLEQANKTRQKEVEESLNEFIAKQLDRIVGDVVFVEMPIAQGYAGILAAKISEMTHKPALVACYNEKEDNNKVVGSARSYGNVDLLAVLEVIKDELLGFGGHKLAAGFSYLHPQIQQIQEKIRAIKLPALAEEATSECLPVQLDPQWQFASAVANYATEPHGVGNPAFHYSVTGDLYKITAKAGGKFTSVSLRSGALTGEFMVWDTYQNVSQQIAPLTINGILSEVRLEYSANFNPEKTDFPLNLTVDKIFHREQVLYDPKKKKIYEIKRQTGGAATPQKYQNKLPVSPIFKNTAKKGLI